MKHEQSALSHGQEDPWPPGFDCIYPAGMLIILPGEHDSQMLVTEALVWAALHTWPCSFTVFVMPRCETALLHSCPPVRHSCPRKHATWSSCSRSSIHKIFFGLEISLILTFLAATARSGELHQATCLSRVVRRSLRVPRLRGQLHCCTWFCWGYLLFRTSAVILPTVFLCSAALTPRNPGIRTIWGDINDTLT